MSHIEAMKQALEALEEINKLSVGDNAICLPAEIDTAIDSLRKAIAEAEKQEPVLWQWKDSEMVTPFEKTNVEGWQPLYTHPQPKREPLTDEEIFKALKGVDISTARVPPGFALFARAIEAAHGIKENT
jgi:hypothetical protein